jgi:hypothetical protein
MQEKNGSTRCDQITSFRFELSVKRTDLVSPKSCANLRTTRSHIDLYKRNKFLERSMTYGNEHLLSPYLTHLARSISPSFANFGTTDCLITPETDINHTASNNQGEQSLTCGTALFHSIACSRLSKTATFKIGANVSLLQI